MDLFCNRRVSRNAVAWSPTVSKVWIGQLAMEIPPARPDPDAGDDAGRHGRAGQGRRGRADR